MLETGKIIKWNVSNGNNFSCMFNKCSSLSDIKGLEKWDVSKCTNFYRMFYGCYKIVDRKLINEKFK